MRELGSVSFNYRNYSVPKGVDLGPGGLTVTVENSEHLEQLKAFFEEIFVVLTTTRNVYQFRSDPE